MIFDKYLYFLVTILDTNNLHTNIFVRYNSFSIIYLTHRLDPKNIITQFEGGTGNNVNEGLIQHSLEL